jgi:hypothetical protein
LLHRIGPDQNISHEQEASEYGGEYEGRGLPLEILEEGLKDKREEDAA